MPLTAVNNNGQQISAIAGDSIDVEIAAATFGSLTDTVVAAEWATALFDIEVCVTHDASGVHTCTTTSGLGNWRLNDIEVGTYAIVAADNTGVDAATAESGFVTEGQISFVEEIAMAFFTPRLSNEPRKPPTRFLHPGVQPPGSMAQPLVLHS